MLIAIISAMEEELALIRDRIAQPEKIQVGKQVFYQGLHGSHQVVVTLSGVGKGSAAAVTGILAGKFSPDCMIMTGLAAALHPALKLGDIVVCNQCVQHDVDARPNFQQYQLPFNDAVFHADANLIKLGEQAANTFVTTHLHNDITATDLALFDITHPRCMVGPIATGDQFITDSIILQNLHASIKKQLQVEIVAVDMETAAVIEAAQKFGIPAVALRVISDKGINKDYQKFKHSIAGRYTAGIIENFLHQLSLKNIAELQ